MREPTDRRLAVITAGLLLLLLAWDATPLDMSLARWAGSAAGFPLRDDWLLVRVLHEGGRWLSWALALALSLGVWWPYGPLRRIDSSRRLQLAAGALLAALVVALAKASSASSCPWDLAAFGGVAQYRPHWHWPPGPDGGGGRCFPAGHASAGFAFVAGYFPFRRAAPVVARCWLGAALLAGFVFGAAQQLRGAHFMSHTLWTGWLCWASAWLVDRAWPDRQLASFGPLGPVN